MGEEKKEIRMSASDIMIELKKQSTYLYNIYKQLKDLNIKLSSVPPKPQPTPAPPQIRVEQAKPSLPRPVNPPNIHPPVKPLQPDFSSLPTVGRGVIKVEEPEWLGENYPES